MDELLSRLESLPPGQLPELILSLLEHPPVILLLAVVIEQLLPIPDSWRLGRLKPVFRVLGDRVNRTDNTPTQTYISGLMLPAVILVFLLGMVLVLELLAGFDVYMSLILLPLLLESRVSLRASLRVTRLLEEGEKRQARRALARAVMRETYRLSPMGICKACTEMCTQHMFCGWFAVMVWYLAAGLPGAVTMQIFTVLSRTFSDKDPRYVQFGASIRRIYHILLLLPVLILALTMLCSFAPLQNLRRGWQALKDYPAAAAGFVLGAIGSCLNISLGGPRYYAGTLIHYPRLGGMLSPGLRTPVQAYSRMRMCGIILICTAVAYSVLSAHLL